MIQVSTRAQMHTHREISVERDAETLIFDGLMGVTGLSSNMHSNSWLVSGTPFCASPASGRSGSMRVGCRPIRALATTSQ